MTPLIDMEAEQAVLGAILLANTLLPSLIVDEALAPDDFGVETHQRIWRAMLELYDAGEAIDPLTLSRKTGIDAAKVDVLAAATPDAANARHHARLIKRAALRRRWQRASELLSEAASADDEQLVAQAEQALAEPTVTDDTWTRERLASEAADYLDTRIPIAISTGFPLLDDIIGGGFRPGDMTVLGGWENMGKTPLLDQWLALAARNGLRSHVYINEMSARDRALRMIAHMGAAPWSAISTRKLTDRQADRFLETAQQLPFEVTDVAQWSAEQIARHIRVNRWDICGLDHIHQMPFRDERELSQIVVTLANAARSSGAHLIVVAQLNQERAKTDVLPRPVRRDLRGTGMLAKAAAQVVMLHREQELVDGFVQTSKIATIVADKAKHGRAGDGIEVVFDFETMSFRVPTALELQAGVAA